MLKQFNGVFFRFLLTKLVESINQLEPKHFLMDILFLLKPNFLDSARDADGISYYCPDCAFLEGVLAYYPELRQKLDIRYIDYPRPRREIVALVGEEHQGCPNLIVDPANYGYSGISEFYRFNDRYHTDDTRLLVNYLSAVYGVPVAHY